MKNYISKNTIAFMIVLSVAIVPCGMLLIKGGLNIRVFMNKNMSEYKISEKDNMKFIEKYFVWGNYDNIKPVRSIY